MNEPVSNVLFDLIHCGHINERPDSYAFAETVADRELTHCLA